MAARHPLEVIPALVARYGPELELSFTRYEIGPSGNQDRRRTEFGVQADVVDAAWLSRQLTLLAPDEELAIHSEVIVDGERCHMPMLDFSDTCSPARAATLGEQAIAAAARKLEIADPHVFVYASGRSCHGYADILIPESAWPAYLGGLLLLDPPETVPLVDVRWVGHAVIRGFAALRWTNNTARYLRVPG